MKAMSAGSGSLVVVAVAMLAINATQACGGQYEAPAPAHTKPVAAAPIEPVTASGATASAQPAIAKTPVVEAKDARATASAKTASHLTVKRLVVAHGVKGHEPEGAASSFKIADAGRIYAFVEVGNAEKEPGEIFVSFEPPPGSPARLTYGDVKLSVGAGPRWRTWAFTRTAREAGEWVAVVRNAKGEVLARAPFEVTL